MTTGRRTNGGRPTALVVGGTGPTGPDIVNGLVARGYAVTVFHSGRHEVPLPEEVAHIHGDAHFPDTIAEALGSTEYDVVIAQYGRLRHLVEHFRGRAGHVIAIGGMLGPLLEADDAEWGAMGRPAIVRDDERRLIRERNEGNGLGFRIAEAWRLFFEAHAEGAFGATYIAYPNLYGPRQPGCPEWSIVRRIRDGRRRIILPDSGLRLETRGYVHNVSRAPLLAVDNAVVADGKSYVVADDQTYTTRQRVLSIARHMGVEVELVDMPHELARPMHPFFRHGPDHRLSTTDLARTDLGYADAIDTDTAIGETVGWLLDSPEDVVAEVEKQLLDEFDYGAEDELVTWWEETRRASPLGIGEAFTYSHIYRHPTRPGEDWKPV